MMGSPPPPSVPQSSEAAASQDSASSAQDTDGRPAASAADTAPVFSPPAAPDEIGQLGPYRVQRQLGQGGMGVVYLAMDARLGRRLALKVMLPKYAADLDSRERFLREARAAAQLTHDHIVTIYEADEREGIPYIAMQLLQGLSLDDYLKSRGQLPLGQALRIAKEAAAGLGAAHVVGLVHRDIKPANLWIEQPSGRVKVLDFGLAKPVSDQTQLTATGLLVGTPAYMSPEQARGRPVDARSDLFSLGVVLYRMLTGQLPFEGPNVMSVLMALGTEDPTPIPQLNPGVPDAVNELVQQLLAKKPQDRPQTAEDARRRLSAFCKEFPDYTQPRASGPLDPSAYLHLLQQSIVHVPIPEMEVTQPHRDSHDIAKTDVASQDEPESLLKLTPPIEPSPSSPPTTEIPQQAPLNRYFLAFLATLLILGILALLMLKKTLDGTRLLDD